jgi:tetratricopeptide (TPR) repeat protein
VWGYRSKDVARLLGLPVSQVRCLVRDGLVASRRGAGDALRFSFQDLVLLRAAADLGGARVPASRVRRALRYLRARLPEGRPLTGVRIAADGEHVIVQEGGARWRPETGQVLLDFAMDERRVATPVVHAVVRVCARAQGPSDAEAWYRCGRDLEGVARGDAKAAYRRALVHERDHAGAHLHLGRLLHEEGDACAAELHYRLALGATEHRARASFLLGVALEDQELLDEALLAYARAIAADPTAAESHQGASRLLERLGRPAEALRHLAEYRKLEAACRKLDESS